MTVCKETEFAYPKWPHCGFKLWLQRVYLNTTSPKNDARRCPLYRPMGYQSQARLGRGQGKYGTLRTSNRSMA